MSVLLNTAASLWRRSAEQSRTTRVTQPRQRALRRHSHQVDRSYAVLLREPRKSASRVLSRWARKDLTLYGMGVFASSMSVGGSELGPTQILAC
jgi:hypothetical protein